MRTLCAIPMLSLLIVCAGCARDKPPTAPLPPSLLEPCPAPVPLPDRAISDQEVEILWGRDRSALRACGSRHLGLGAAL